MKEKAIMYVLMLLLASILTSVSLTISQPDEERTWIIYDNNLPNGDGATSGAYYPGFQKAVLFTPPYTPCRIITASFLFKYPMNGYPEDFKVHVTDSFHQDLMPPYLVKAPYPTSGWLNIDLWSFNLIVNSDFFVSMECLHFNPWLIRDEGRPVQYKRSYLCELLADKWVWRLDDYPSISYNYYIRAEVAKVHVPTPIVSVDPSEIEALYNTNFTINLNIENVTDLIAWQARVSWDPKLLNLTDTWLNVNRTEGWVFLSELSISEPITGSKTLISLSFQTVGLGQCALGLETKLFNSSSYSVPAPPNLGDANGDGRVNQQDNDIVTKSFGSLEGQQKYNSNADFNKDGLVDLFDLLCISYDFGKNYPSSTANKPAEIEHEVQEGGVSILLRTDLNGDGKVDILDIFIVAQAFGSNPGDPNWNAIADLNKDNTVNILDIFAVAWDFGKSA